MAKEQEKEQENDKENEAVEKKSGSSTLKIVIIAVVLILMLGGGTLYFMSTMDSDNAASEKNNDEEDGAESEPALPPKYHSMDPKFVVSFRDQKNARFMQFSLEIMSRNDEVVKHIESHMPVVRSSLLMLFGGQAYEDMVTREGKEKLLMDVVDDINTTLQKIIGEADDEVTVEAAYFNSFVIQ